MEERSILLVRGDEQVRCQLRWELMADLTCNVSLDGPNGAIGVSDVDFLAALNQLRRAFAVDGWLIAVQGSRIDSYASGMIRDMLSARRVYVIQMGRHALRGHLVDIFADADPAQVGTDEQQAEFYKAWRKSVVNVPPPDPV